MDWRGIVRRTQQDGQQKPYSPAGMENAARIALELIELPDVTDATACAISRVLGRVIRDNGIVPGKESVLNSKRALAIAQTLGYGLEKDTDFRSKDEVKKALEGIMPKRNKRSGEQNMQPMTLRDLGICCMVLARTRYSADKSENIPPELAEAVTNLLNKCVDAIPQDSISTANIKWLGSIKADLKGGGERPYSAIGSLQVFGRNVAQIPEGRVF